MSVGINTYESPVEVGNEITAPATLTVTETDIFKTTDQRYLHLSQLTIMASVVLSGLTSATLRYYLSPDGTVWYPISLYNTSTGEMTQRSVVLDSGSNSTITSGSWSAMDNVPLGAGFAFKITGLSNTGTPAYTLKVIGRNN
jgi:hypothetical protein